MTSPAPLPLTNPPDEGKVMMDVAATGRTLALVQAVRADPLASKREGDLATAVVNLTAALAERDGQVAAAEAKFAAHTEAVKKWAEELGPYIGLDDGTVKPVDFIEAAKRCRDYTEALLASVAEMRSALELREMDGAMLNAISDAFTQRGTDHYRPYNGAAMCGPLSDALVRVIHEYLRRAAKAARY